MLVRLHLEGLPFIPLTIKYDLLCLDKTHVLNLQKSEAIDEITFNVEKSSSFPASKTQSGSHTNSKTSTHAQSREHTQTQYAVRTMSTDTTRSLPPSLSLSLSLSFSPPLPPSLPRSSFRVITRRAVQFYLHQPLISGTAAQTLPIGEDRPRYCLYPVVE